MLCDECGVNPAIFHFVSIVDGEATERDLCPACMARMSIDIPNQNAGGLEGIIKNLLEKHIEKKKPEEEEYDPAAESIFCRQCGMSFAEFKKIGMFGCSGCPEAFRVALIKPLERIHGNTQHAGRIQGGTHNGTSIRLNIDRLRRELSLAIENEEYEQAAKLRDAIRVLEAQLARQESSVRVYPKKSIRGEYEGGAEDA